jgi:hypothetical protein
MNRKLKDIAEIMLGYQHREKVSHIEHGTHRLIQGKDLVSSESLLQAAEQPVGWRIVTDNLNRVTPKGDAARYALRPGDVLFVSRGTSNVAVPLNQETVTPFPDCWDDIIAAYTFYVVRPDAQHVLPEYLAWVINQAPAQSYLASQSRGTLVKLLPKSIFEELDVPVPPLALQRQVMELEQLRAHEQSLLKRLIAARQRVVQHTCLLAIDTKR